jgi:MFS family permease
MVSRNVTVGSVRKLPAGILVLGLVSMLMDMSSELMLSLLPVFMTTVLGAGMVSVGVVEGFSEAAASLMKVVSGAWSDRIRRRKPLALLGYGLSALTKPLFPLAGSIGLVFAARFVDRVGKGIRGAPRDALVAELAPQGMQGAAFGLRQALDSAGAFLGPLLAVLLMHLCFNDIKAVFWVGTIPALLCILLLGLGLREPPVTPHAKENAGASFSFSGFSRMPASFWIVVSVGAAFTLARFSDAFLVLKALHSGLPAAYVPLVLVVMNLVYSGVSYPAGVMSDRYGSRGQLVTGITLLVAANLVLAASYRLPGLAVGVLLWGAHLGFTQGVLSRMVAASAPSETLATGFGIFNFLNGIAVLFSSLVAGLLWQHFGVSATFMAGSIFAMLAGAVIAATWRSSSWTGTGRP